GSVRTTAAAGRASRSAVRTWRGWGVTSMVEIEAPTALVEDGAARSDGFQGQAGAHELALPHHLAVDDEHAVLGVVGVGRARHLQLPGQGRWRGCDRWGGRRGGACRRGGRGGEDGGR